MGSGAPLVYLGMPCCGHVQHELELEPLASWYSSLAERVQLVRLDLRGYGASQRDGVELSIEGFGRDILAVADAVGLSNFSLFAQGGSSPAAISLAAQSKRVDHLILFDGWADGPNLPTHQAVQAAQGVADFDFRMFATMVTRLVLNAPEEIANDVTRLLRLAASRDEWHRFLELFTKTDVGPLLSSIECPTLVVHSGPGPLTGQGEESLALARDIPGARLATFLAPHFPFADTTEIYDVMMEFLAPGPVRDFESLSPREIEVLELLAMGKKNQQIAEELVISLPTVARHVHNLLTKLEFSNRTEAGTWAAGRQRSP